MKSKMLPNLQFTVSKIAFEINQQIDQITKRNFLFFYSMVTTIKIDFFTRERGFIQVKLLHLDLQTQPRMELAANLFLKQTEFVCALGFDRGKMCVE